MTRLAGRNLLALVLLLVASSLCWGESQGEPHFERVGSESGAPSAVITAIYQDRTGFIWIGSRDGLTLYDGHSFTTFEHNPSDPSSISDDAIRTVYEDREGALWIGTNTGGLNRLDRGTWKFKRFRHDSSDPRSLSHDSVYAIVEDRDGGLWVGTQRGLNRLDRKSGAFERFMADSSVAGSLSHNYVGALLFDRRGRLWVGTVGGGLDRRDPGTGKFQAWRHDPRVPQGLGDDSVFALLEEDSGALWIGTNAGLDRMDPDGTFRHFRHDAGDRSSLSHAIVSSLAPGAGGRIWIGTFGGGLNELNTKSGVVHAFRHDPSRGAGLPADRVLSLLADKAGALWVGTWGGGLSRVSGSALLLASGSGDASEPSDLKDRDVTDLARDATGGLWVGTRSGTLFRRDPLTRKYRRYLAKNPGSILRILPVKDGTVWVGTTSSLLHLSPDTGEVAAFRHDPASPASLGPGYVTALLEDSRGRLWVGTGEGGLQEIDGDGHVLRRYVHDSADATSLSDEYVTTIREDRSGTLWVGTRSGGLNALDSRTGRAVRHLTDPANPDAISHHNVTAILEDAKGRLWVATAGGGLNRADRNQTGRLARFTRFTAADGLVDNNVMAILEDDDGSLWLSTKRGLSRFAPETGSFVNYLVADGLPTGEFEFGAAARTGGSLNFGSVKWVVAIPAGTPFPTVTGSPTVVTSLRIQSEDLHADRPPWALTRLEIPYGAWLSVEVAVLDFTTEHNHAHAYRLGPNKDWIDLGSRRTITFADLAPGTYAFEARGRNCQGVWSAMSHPLQLRVVPPFWMTLWFRFLAGGLLVATAFLAHRARLSAVERRNRELLELHKQRERTRRELERTHERLKVLARRLEAAKEEERKKIARELHDELGSVLTAVVINLQLLGTDRHGAKATRWIEDSIDALDRTLERIRDLSLNLRPPLLDEMGLVPALKGYLETQADRTGLQIEVRDESPLEDLPDEVEITAFRVAQEAVTNAIRHGAANRIVVSVRDGDGALEITVEDDGKGFDGRAAIEGSTTGKNLGLLGMQERAGMLGGWFELESAPGKGTRVRIRIPMEGGA